jgi:hypothetical protein
MAHDDFPNAPDMMSNFSHAQDERGAEQRPNGTPDANELLDDHDLSTWDYTPGGTIEQSVHTGLSDAGRSAYREATRPSEQRDQDELYERQLDAAFERAAANDDAVHEFGEQADESRGEAIRRKDGQVRERIAAQTLGEAAKKARDGRLMTGAELAESYANRVSSANREMTDADYGVTGKEVSHTYDEFHPWADVDHSHRERRERSRPELDVLGPSFEKAHGREEPEIER